MVIYRMAEVCWHRLRSVAILISSGCLQARITKCLTLGTGCIDFFQQLISPYTRLMSLFCIQDGLTPLHLAALSNNMAAVVKLLDLGGNPSAISKVSIITRITIYELVFFIRFKVYVLSGVCLLLLHRMAAQCLCAPLSAATRSS
jgi:hypothetical protein